MIAVVLLVIALVLVTVFLDRIIKTGVETVGPRVAKVEIRLGGVSQSLFSGKGELKNLFVGNPEGFKTESAIKVGAVRVGLQPASVFSPKIVIDSISVEAPEITLEGLGKNSNLNKILANIEEFTGGGKAPAGDKSAPQPGKKIQVNEFVIQGGKVNLAIPGLGGKSATVPLPDIRLADLGTGPEGITPAELSKRVISAIYEKATSATASIVGSLGKGAAEAASTVTKSVTDGAGKAVKGIGDLFKKNKDGATTK